MNLYFKNSQGTERLIGSCITNENEAVKVFDVGSHTEFFYLKEEETANE